MPVAFEVHCFGARLGGRPVPAILAAIGLQPRDDGDVDVLDCGDGGVWIRGGPAVDGMPGRMAAEVGRAVRHYRVRAETVDEGVRVEVDGATWWPDGRRVEIRAVTDRFDDDPSADLLELATQALSVTLEVHEDLHEDRAIGRCAPTGRLPDPAGPRPERSGP